MSGRGYKSRVVQTSSFNKAARDAALEAGSFIAGRRGRVRSVHYKGEINVVTDVDKKAEQMVVSRIRKRFPHHSFLAEENKYEPADRDYLWIIDPLDGTTNYLHDFPFFCVSIALQYKGRIITGVVYDPVREELFSAERGKGARLNGKEIWVSGIRKLKQALVATGFAYDFGKGKNNNIANFIRFLKKSQAVRRAGSAALDLCYVACGRFDGFWEFYLNPWDTAAGLLVLEESGGLATKTDGSEYTVYNKQILASNSFIHKEMVRVLSGK